ncbi:hypothetical protein ABZV93_00475 [Actinopolymorpha sp. NPDC004070]|uniref:hypothetical protein n=1 Tax=Actinopolymorpha sp. NPDC004070 TaxID=3154548 RepID=UPI0033A8847F
MIDLMASVATLEDVTTDRDMVLKRLGYQLQDTGMPGRLFTPRRSAWTGWSSGRTARLRWCRRPRRRTISWQRTGSRRPCLSRRPPTWR